MKYRDIGLLADCRLDELDSGFGLVALVRQHAEEMHGIDIAGILTQNLQI